MKQRNVIILSLAISGLLGFLLSLYVHRSSLSRVTVIETYHYPALFVKQLEGDPDAPRKIFKEFCAACHSEHPPIDIQAPRIHDKKAWHKKRQLGIDTLLQLTIHGVGAMPARGGCFECSDQQLKMTIQYLLQN